MTRPSAISPDQFATFGELLKHLRRRAGLTQRELSIAVGYSDAQISRLEQNLRVPDKATLTATVRAWRTGVHALFNVPMRSRTLPSG